MGLSKQFLFVVLSSILVLFLWFSIRFLENFLFFSFAILLVGIILWIARFENRKIEAKELVMLSVLAAIAAVGRIPFASIPSVQPTTFVIIMSGLVFGAESGFIIGAVAPLASNMLLGQGPWTPWQMMAWGLVGWSAGMLRNSRLMSNTWGRILFGVIWGFLFGWIMNIWSFMAFSQAGDVWSVKSIVTYLSASILFDSMHSISNVILLLLFANTWIQTLTRFKRKYGLLEK